MKSSPVFALAVLCAFTLCACQSKNEPAAFAPPPPPPTGILSADELDQPPRLLHPPRPARYPEELARKKISGTATIRFIVTHDGRLIDVTVVSASHPAFGQAAADEIATWQYKPGIKDGLPIACYLSVPVVFDITGKGAP